MEDNLGIILNDLSLCMAAFAFAKTHNEAERNVFFDAMRERLLGVGFSGVAIEDAIGRMKESVKTLDALKHAQTI